MFGDLIRDSEKMDKVGQRAAADNALRRSWQTDLQRRILFLSNRQLDMWLLNQWGWGQVAQRMSKERWLDHSVMTTLEWNETQLERYLLQYFAGLPNPPDPSEVNNALSMMDVEEMRRWVFTNVLRLPPQFMTMRTHLAMMSEHEKRMRLMQILRVNPQQIQMEYAPTPRSHQIAQEMGAGFVGVDPKDYEPPSVV